MTSGIKVVAAPRDENPYQEFVYRHVRRAGVAVDYADGPTRSQSMNLLLAPLQLAHRRWLGYRILHLHWVFQFTLPWAKGHNVARGAMEFWFGVYLAVANRLGYSIVWTAHDLLPHQRVFLDDRRARRTLLRRAAAVLAPSEATAKELRNLGARGVHVIPFGAYDSPYPVKMSRLEARSKLGFAKGDRVVLLIGKIAPYKGADLLIRAAAELPEHSPLRILVVGACAHPSYRELLERLAVEAGSAVVTHLERVPDEDMAMYLTAADVAAFPFRAVTNSSSILLAQSFGLPVVIPRLASLDDIDDEAAFRFDEGGLVGVLRRVASASPAELEAKGRRGQETSTAADWSDVARMTIGVYEEVLDETRATADA